MNSTTNWKILRISKTNPIFLLIGFQIIILFVRGYFLPEYSLQEISAYLQQTLIRLGLWSYIILITAYALCSFFFIPVVISLNLFSGMLYGPVMGSAVSLLGITIGGVASAVSVRHVFKGLHFNANKVPIANKILRLSGIKGGFMVILVRLAFLLPYSIQNITIGLSQVGLIRLGMLTAIGALPGVIAYNLIGAGFMLQDDARKVGLYIAFVLSILLVTYIAMGYLRKKHGNRSG